jgi:hypothetical protein
MSTKPLKSKTSLVRRQGDHDANNLACARIILEDPEKHGGEAAFIVRWARQVMSRLGLEKS